MKLLGSTKLKMTKEKINENLAHLKTTEVALSKRYFSIIVLLTMIINIIQVSSKYLFQINRLVNY